MSLKWLKLETSSFVHWLVMHKFCTLMAMAMDMLAMAISLQIDK